MRLRLVEPGDAEAIRAIYNEEVENHLNTFDLVTRSAAEQLAWVERHRGAHPAIVAVADGSGPDGPGGAGEVLGFGVIAPFRDRAAYATTVEDSVYVHQDHRGRGVGRAVVTELVRLAGTQGFHTVIARISSTNEASIALHRRCGFELVGIEREVGRKHGRWLDIVELQRML
jgi:phosphinothricin acetyltransferase